MEKKKESHEENRSKEQESKEDKSKQHEKSDAEKPKEAHKTHKKSAHKAHPKTVKIRRRRKKSPVWPYVLGLIVIIAIVALAINFDRLFPSQEPVEVAAIVNGQVIPMSTIDQQYNLLPQQMQSQVQRSTILNKTIDEVLLLQEAKDKGIEVQDQEVEQLLDSYMAQSGITRSMLDQQLAQNNMSYEDLKEVYRKQIIITKLLNETVISKLEVSDEEIENYYEENEEGEIVRVQEQVKARHILVDNRSAAEDILDRIEEGESFADLAQEYSLDPGSAQRGGDLGYFYEGQMVPEFNEAAFSMAVNSTPQIVETQFGFHVIEVTGKKEARYRSLEEASDMIRQTLLQEKQNEAIQSYIDELRDEARITIRMEEARDDPDGIQTFSSTGDQICTEDGKPIVRVYTTSTCPHCEWVQSTVDQVLKDYQGEIVAHHWVIDKQDDILTDQVEGEIPQAEMDAYREYNQQGYVPFFLFGCKYMRIGNGYEQQDDLAKEKQEFERVIETLLDEPQVTIS